MDVKYSRRILAVGAPDPAILKVIKDLTGSAPTPHENGSTAGLTHEWDLQTRYYAAKIPIWVDEIPDVAAWKTEFLKPEAAEVVQAVGAWILYFRESDNGSISQEAEDAMKAIQEISEKHANYAADAVMLAVAMRNVESDGSNDGAQEEIDDVCLQHGFEYIDYTAKGTNKFGEKTGLERLREALEANEWPDVTTTDDDGLEADESDFDAENGMRGFARDEAEMTAELFGVNAALAGDDFEPEADDIVPPNQQASQIDDLDRLIGRILAIKEQSVDLPEAQKKRMAAKAVKELLKADESV